MTSIPDETPALDDLEANPDEHAGAEVEPDHDLDVTALPEDET